MWQYTLRLEGFDKLNTNVGKLQRGFPLMAARVMRTSAIATLVPPMRAALRKNHSIFTGELHSRLTARSGITNGSPWVEIGSFGVPYGLNIEKGAPPHTPDAGRIAEYVRKKMKYTGAKADSVTALIINTIETVGTKPHPFMVPTWNANRDRFFNDFIQRMMGKGFRASLVGP